MTALPMSRPDSRLASLARQYPAPAFFTLALLASWSVWVPASLWTSPKEVHVMVGAFGPALAAGLVTWLRGDSVRAWLTACLTWRVSGRWYAITLGLPVLAGAVMGAVFVATTGTFEADRLARYLPMYPAMLVVLMLVGGGQEEFGWRGFALPALQERFDALTASVVLGVVWAVWHGPLFVFDVAGYGSRSFPLYVGLVVGFAIIFTWLYNNTGGSVLLAMVLHGGINAASGLGGAFVAEPASVGFPILLAYILPVWTIAGLLVVRNGHATLSTTGEPTRVGQ